jgi:hypothetical protein
MRRGIFTRMTMIGMLAVMLAPVAPAAAQAGGGAGDVMALTALDYIEIEQLVYKYARAIDTCSNNGYDYADLFTADGFFAPATPNGIGTRWQGRERLAEVSGGGARKCENVGWIEQGVLHIYVNHVITPTADGAVGAVDMLMIGLGGDPNRIEHDGWYEDAYEKTPAGWRFKSRVHHTTANRGQQAPRPQTRE